MTHEPPQEVRECRERKSWQDEPSGWVGGWLGCHPVQPSFLALPLRLPCGRWAWWDRSTIITHLPTSFRTHRVFVPTWCGSFLLHFRSYTLHCPSAPVVHHDTSAWEVSPPLTELVPLGLAGFDATSPQGAAPQHELGWCCDLRAESRIVLYVSFERGVGCVMFSPPVVAKVKFFRAVDFALLADAFFFPWW